MMACSRLSELQRRILALLSGLEARWTLVGGGALAGFHLAHRDTRDLDLFFRPMDGLGEIGDDAKSMLAGAGFGVVVITKTHDFVRLRVSSGSEAMDLDLVSEPAAPPLHPMEATVSGASIWIATRAELLASKLCTMMNRAEIRDLVDIRALLAAGEDLEAALRIAPSIDTGFSPPTLAWVVKDLDAGKIARAEGIPEDEAKKLASFKDRLVEILVSCSRP